MIISLGGFGPLARIYRCYMFTGYDKEKGLDKRKIKRELEAFKKQVMQNGGRLPGNAEENEAGGQRVLREAEANKAKQEEDRKKDLEAWAKDHATTVARKMKGAVDVIGGIGEGRKNKCSYCGEGGGHMKGTWDTEKKEVVYECDPCRKANIDDNKSYLKIICKW